MCLKNALMAMVRKLTSRTQRRKEKNAKEKFLRVFLVSKLPGVLRDLAAKEILPF
jgi:hypothetical protein